MRLAVLTDLGSITAHMIANVAGCDAIVLECNHDAAMLAQSRYPASLKARIGGRFGHLSNATAAEILARCASARLRHVVAAHLSRENNRPDLARAALAACLGGNGGDAIVVADPLAGFEWLQLG
jgi:phosphoribosyl 1,2-cyclic phosphodiesterase